MQDYLQTNLKDSPEYKKQTLELIEKSFHYNKSNSFEIDFAPLLTRDNLKNCHILVDEEFQVVISHIGVLKKDLQINATHPIALIGGVCVHEDYRGTGLFSLFFNNVINKYSEQVALFTLWSDQTKLYSKFGFNLCIEQLQFNKKENAATGGYQKTLFKNLSLTHKNQIKTLYIRDIQKKNNTLKRTNKDWDTIEKIDSSDLYIKLKSDVIVSYFFINKGQDLTNTIHEIAGNYDIDEVTAYGDLWCSKNPNQNKAPDKTLYAALVKPAQFELFRKLVFDYSNNEIIITAIVGSEIQFNFKKSEYALELKDFLVGLWGPFYFKEFSFESRPLFISGLDSV